MDRATRADVARAAGVAPSTVSLVLNGRGPEVKIAPATIQRVQDAARTLNYIPNAAARSLRRGSSRLIALLMAELPDNPFVPVVHTVLTTAMIEIQRRGYLLLPLFQSSADPSDAETIRAVLGDTQLAGVIRETTSAESFASTLFGSPCWHFRTGTRQPPIKQLYAYSRRTAKSALLLLPMTPKLPAYSRQQQNSTCVSPRTFRSLDSETKIP